MDRRSSRSRALAAVAGVEMLDDVFAPLCSKSTSMSGGSPRSSDEKPSERADSLCHRVDRP
jgi:hypothetical protein